MQMTKVTAMTVDEYIAATSMPQCTAQLHHTWTQAATVMKSYIRYNNNENNNYNFYYE